MRTKQWRPYCYPPGVEEAWIDSALRRAGIRLVKRKTLFCVVDQGKFDPEKVVRHYFAPLRRER